MCTPSDLLTGPDAKSRGPGNAVVKSMDRGSRGGYGGLSPGDALGHFRRIVSRPHRGVSFAGSANPGDGLLLSRGHGQDVGPGGGIPADESDGGEFRHEVGGGVFG